MLYVTRGFAMVHRSVFAGDKLLTTPNNEVDRDKAMFEGLGLYGRPPFIGYTAGAPTSDGSEFPAAHVHTSACSH